ncbi:MAG: hypothetical protein KJ922_05645 [Nanoarchaeota archaeon]|nr:hypothetical protein [Nanoarchaeota archaeon]
MENAQNTGNQPEKKFSTGAISATVWKNAGTAKTGEEREYRTVSIQRRYTDKAGKWQTTSSMRINDLPKAALVITKAYEYLVLKNQDDVTLQDDVEDIVM